MGDNKSSSADLEIPDLVAFRILTLSLFIPCICHALQKQRKVFDKESNANVSMTFMHCEITDS